MNYRFNEIKLAKGMYAEYGKSFAQILEELDPSENYYGTVYEGLDAYQRQLKRFDIKVRGAKSDCVSAFFATNETAVLFPEYVIRCVRAGVEEDNILRSIVASTTISNSINYGVYRPDTNTLDFDYIKLNKRGRMLVGSYDAIAHQRLDLFSIVLRKIGMYIMRGHLEDAIGVIMSGGSNIGDTAEGLSYKKLISFWNDFAPYCMSTLLVSPDMMLKLMALPEFNAPIAGLYFQNNGELFYPPLGIKLIRTSAVPEGTIIGLDKQYALQMVKQGDISVDYERLIDKKFERSEISSVMGFAKIYDDASKVLKVR